MPATLRCEIFPADLDATAAFYVDVLAFEIVRDERDRQAPYLALRRGDVHLGAAQRAAVADEQQRRPPVGVELVLEVDDLEADRARVAAPGGRWPRTSRRARGGSGTSGCSTRTAGTGASRREPDPAATVLRRTIVAPRRPLSCRG